MQKEHKKRRRYLEHGERVSWKTNKNPANCIQAHFIHGGFNKLHSIILQSADRYFCAHCAARLGSWASTQLIFQQLANLNLMLIHSSSIFTICLDVHMNVWRRLKKLTDTSPMICFYGSFTKSFEMTYDTDKFRVYS